MLLTNTFQCSIYIHTRDKGTEYGAQRLAYETLQRHTKLRQSPNSLSLEVRQDSYPTLSPLRELRGVGISKPSFPRKREPTKWLAARQSRGGASFDKLRTNDLLVYLPLSALEGEGRSLPRTRYGGEGEKRTFIFHPPPPPRFHQRELHGNAPLRGFRRNPPPIKDITIVRNTADENIR